MTVAHDGCSHDVARRRPQKWTVTTVKAPHNVFELPDRVNNMFALILLLVMEWSLYLHLERHDWFAAAALRTHTRPRNHRKLLTCNPMCERKPQRKASCTRQATTSVHTVVVAMAWGARCAPLHHQQNLIMWELEPTNPSMLYDNSIPSAGLYAIVWHGMVGEPTNPSMFYKR